MITSMQIKSEVLNILKAFDVFCKENNIQYCLAYGTLLGAIRHKGFIPWDDDIDVILTTSEYYKLREIGKSNPYIDTEKRYKLRIPGDTNYCYSFMKVEDTNYLLREKNVSDTYSIGLFIDVFRVDYWPESKAAETFQLKKARLMLKMNEVCIRGNIKGGKYAILDKLLKPIDFLYKLFGLKTETFCAALERQGKNNRKSRFVGNIMSGSGRKTERLDADIFDEYIFVHFEDAVFPAPEKYDKFLKTIYGDYMKIPPEKNQINHEYDIRWMKVERGKVNDEKDRHGRI